MTEPAPEGARTPWWKWALGAAAIAGLAVGFALLPLGAWITDFAAWARGQGAVGGVVFAAAYIGATVLLVPGALLTLAAGFIWGPLWGTALVSPVSVAAACAAFICGRTLLRRRVEAHLAQRPRLRVIDRAVGQRGALIVLLLRLSPVLPFTWLNYLLSLTSVSLPRYAAASFIGMLPATFMYVYIGSTLTKLGEASTGETDAAEQILFWGGLGATVAVTWLVTRLARRALREATPEALEET